MVKFSRRAVTYSDLWVSSDEKLSDFYLSSWQAGESPIPMLLVRLILATVSVAILAWALYEGGNRYWFIFLTNWGLILIVMTILSGLIVSLIAVCKSLPDEGKLPWYMSMYWLIFNVTTSISIIITALYWILLYDPEPQEETSSTGKNPVFLLDLSTHALNSCIMMVEFLACRTPVRLLHIYQPLGVGLWYTAFSAIYYLLGGTDLFGNPYIYEVLDWRQSRRAGIIVGASMGGIIVIYLILWGLALCRDSLSTAMVRTTSHNLPQAPPDMFFVNGIA